LSEFAYFMGDENMPSGYGSMYGQVKHPTHENIDPYGSSTGSAVAVALGSVPFAIGTETNGSLMAPAHQCQIVALKPTHGIVPSEGIIPISPSQDTAGPMAKNVFDCAAVMDVLVDDHHKPKPGFSYVDALQSTNKVYRVGVLELTNYPYSESEKKLLNQIQGVMKSLGWELHSFLLEYPPLENFETLKREFKVSLNEFLKNHVGEGAPQDLAAIIAFNEANKERCLRYGQKALLDSQMRPDALDEEFYQIKSNLLKEASLLDTLLHTHQLDAVVTLGWLSFAPIFGNPSLCTPEGWLEGQPKGLVWVGKKHEDATLLQLGHFYYDKSKLSS
jgi:amidase